MSNLAGKLSRRMFLDTSADFATTVPNEMNDWSTSSSKGGFIDSASTK